MHRFALCLLLPCIALVACDSRRLGSRDSGSARDGGSTGIDAGEPLDGGQPFDAALPLDGGHPVDAGRPRDAGRDAFVPPPIDGGMRTTIGAIQRDEIPVGMSVLITGVVVTAVRSDGVWVQDPAGGSMYSGVKVYLAAAPAAVRNDRVDVTGIVGDYFGDTEIDSATITVRGTATPIAPARLTVAEASTEPYESVLVTLTDATTVESPYDCTLDNPACVDVDLWRLNSSIVVYDGAYEGADWTSWIGATRITGVMGWRFDRRRIQPRTAADLAF